jgi:hypothetical protein
MDEKKQPGVCSDVRKFGQDFTWGWLEVATSFRAVQAASNSKSHFQPNKRVCARFCQCILSSPINKSELHMIWLSLPSPCCEASRAVG